MLKEILKNKDLCKIRTITSFLTLSKEKSEWEDAIIKAATFGGDLANEFHAHGYHVQSVRLVTNAFGEYLDTSSFHAVLKDMHYLQDVLKSSSMPNIRIRFAIGEAKTPDEIALLPEMIKAYGDICNACVNVDVDELGMVDRELTLCCAKSVVELGRITPRGEGNFNFTINYNCKSHIPYFPASYHNSHDENCFALGLESPDLLVEALKSLKPETDHNVKMHKSYGIMKDALQYHITDIVSIVNAYEHPYKTKFAGIDTSAAPSKNCSSMVDVYKLLGVPYFGASGTLEASALLTKVFKAQKGCDLVGFSGLMLAVVEDEGQIEHFELLHAQRAELGQRRCQHLHRAELQRFHLFLVLVQRAVGVHLDLDLALGQLIGLLGKELGSLALGGVLRHDVAELDDGLRLSQEQEFDGADLSIHHISATPEREANW